MPINPTTISSFTLIPQRSTPSTFETNTDSFLTQISNFVTQTNNSLTSVETNIQELYNTHTVTESSMVIDYGIKTFATSTSNVPIFAKLVAVENSASFMSGIVQSVVQSNSIYNCTFLATELSGQGEGYSDWLVIPCSQPQPWGSNTAPNPTTPAPYGSWWFDNDFFYFCVADNTWRRIALQTW